MPAALRSLSPAAPRTPAASPRTATCARLLGSAASVLLAAAAPDVAAQPAAAAAPDARCLTFAGDLSLSRAVAATLDRGATGNLASLFAPAPALGRRTTAPSAAWVANLEGALQPSPTAPCENRVLCLGIRPGDLQSLVAAAPPPAALSLANNHSHDYGSAAYTATADALRALGIASLSDAPDAAPVLLQRGPITWALVALNAVNRSPAELDSALLSARLRIGLAAAHTPWVAVLPHWGREYDPSPGPTESRLAALFRAWGARLIVGAHPHVIGDRTCAPDFASYYSLGNLLFDQPAPATHTGLLLRCCADAPHTVDCRALTTQRPPHSPWPHPGPPAPAHDCRLQIADPQAAPIDPSWQRHPGASTFLFVQPFRSLGPGTFFVLHRRYSSFDHEHALRPAVFRIVQGRAVDLWRGTALSWPLLAARLIQTPDKKEFLCALHRGDSFVHPDPAAPPARRHYAVYTWSGFGFRRVDDPAALTACQGL